MVKHVRFLLDIVMLENMTEKEIIERLDKAFPKTAIDLYRIERIMSGGAWA